MGSASDLRPRWANTLYPAGIGLGLITGLVEEFVLGYGEGWFSVVGVLYSVPLLLFVLSLPFSLRVHGWCMLVGALPFLAAVPCSFFFLLAAAVTFLLIHAPAAVLMVLGALIAIATDDDRRRALSLMRG